MPYPLSRLVAVPALAALAMSALTLPGSAVPSAAAATPVPTAAASATAAARSAHAPSLMTVTIGRRTYKFPAAALFTHTGANRRAASRAPSSASTQTLTVTATNLAGKPDNGDAVLVANAHNSDIFGQNPSVSVQHFSGGVATYHVPAGPYWALGIFGGTLDAQNETYFARLVVLPRFSVTKKTTVHVAEQAATSKITMVTPRPATPVSTNFTVDHPGQAGPPIQVNFSKAGQQPVQIALFGSLLTSPNGYMNPAPFLATPPYALTAYLGGNVPDMTWRGYEMTLDKQGNSVGGEFGTFIPIPPGTHTTQDWNAYPLHPVVNDNPEPNGWANGLPPSAARLGNTLLLTITPTGDNQPGHLGSGFVAVGADKITGSYTIDQNGKRIAGGPTPPEQGGASWFSTKATLSPKPSVISFGLNVANSGPAFPLSTATHTVWAWHTSRQPSVKLPGDWYCYGSPTGVFTYKCVVQPMMTLRYAVAGMALNGQVPAGPEVVNLTVGHLQLVKPIAITKAAMSVSFDGGKTWQQATVTGSDGHYQAAFDAPAGAYVMTRTSASDAAGGSVTETITRAFQVKS